LQRILAGIAGITCTGINGNAQIISVPGDIPYVHLGKTGLCVPVLALGTGTHGGQRESNQTRLGIKEFVRMARHAYDRGIKFFDMADTYGSHTFVREVLKHIPRDRTTLLTKIWPHDNNWYNTDPVKKTLDRFRTETGSEYFDILLIHCLINGKWKEEMKGFIDSLSEAKENGIIKRVGVSCHNLEAMKIAVDYPWVDVILARINPFGTHMDGTPEEIMSLLKVACNNGKGVIGMKIFGNGDNITESEREKSLHFALTSGNIHCVTLGLENIMQVDDAVEKVIRITNHKL